MFPKDGTANTLSPMLPPGGSTNCSSPMLPLGDTEKSSSSVAPFQMLPLGATTNSSLPVFPAGSTANTLPSMLPPGGTVNTLSSMLPLGDTVKAPFVSSPEPARKRFQASTQLQQAPAGQVDWKSRESANFGINMWRVSVSIFIGETFSFFDTQKDKMKKKIK